METLPVAVAILDGKARVVGHNPLFETLLGSHFRHDRERSFGEVIEPGALGAFLEEMAALVKGRQDRIDYTCRYRSADGSYGRWMHVQIVPLPSVTDRPALFNAVIDDVSNAIDETSRLQREKEIAIQATRSKSAFLATMSHEIRTPIHTVTGMTDLLTDTRLDDEQREYVRQIRFSAEMLLGLINDILDLSKIEAGRLTLEIIDFSLRQVIEDSVDMQSPSAFSKGLELLLDVPDDLPRLVRGDPARLRQIITNLLSNAIKFTRAGEVLLRARQTDSPESGRIIRIEVSDTGIGIPEEKRALLFQVFSQLDSSMNRKFGGSGLGLSICQNLVHLMDGRIGADSQDQRGSTFWFEIPLVETAAAGISELPSAGMLHPALEGRVLIVDDNRAARGLLAAMLKPLGCRVGEAESGEQALAALRSASASSESYDVALIDLEMPGMDGWQLASEINADRTINGTRIYLLVPPGRLAGEAKMRLLNWFDGYIPKPLRIGTVLPVITAALEEPIDLEPADSDAEDSAAPRLDRAPDAMPEEHDSSRLILVAEDHFVNQKLFETILKRLGHRVLLASDGHEAIETAEREHPDLVFMDVQMPGMDGYAATQALRQAGHTFPIIAVTANALKGDQDKCLQAGMNDYLPKPFQRDDVKAMIEKWGGVGRLPRSVSVSGPVKATAVAAFDRTTALAAFMGDAQTLDAVLAAFIERTDNDLAELARLGVAGRLDEARIIAHTIKGAGANLGAVALSAEAAMLEQACAGHDAPAFAPALLSLAAAWQDFKQAATRQEAP